MGCGNSSRLCSNTVVMELIDHLYDCLLAPLAFSIRKSPNHCLCVTTAITKPVYEDPPIPHRLSPGHSFDVGCRIYFSTSSLVESASECFNMIQSYGHIRYL